MTAAAECRYIAYSEAFDSYVAICDYIRICLNICVCVCVYSNTSEHIRIYLVISKVIEGYGG